MAKLHFKYGTMNSGKSIDLMRTAYNYEEVGYNVLIIKPKIDTKGNNKIDSRIGLQRNADILIKEDDSILELINNKKTDKLACIFVDEAQFLSEKQIDELFLITKIINIPVICYGLRNNFKMKAFSGSKRLLEIAEELEELPTLCSCREIARFVGRKVNDIFVLGGRKIKINGTNQNIEYVPLCGKRYLKKVKKINLKNKY